MLSSGTPFAFRRRPQPCRFVLAEHRQSPANVRPDRVDEREVDVGRLRVEVERVGVDERNVQSLEQTLGHRLPVGRYRRLGQRRVVLHLVAAELADLRVEIAEMRRHVDRVVALQHDPHEAVTFLARQLHQPVAAKGRTRRGDRATACRRVGPSCRRPRRGTGTRIGARCHNPVPAPRHGDGSS